MYVILILWPAVTSMDPFPPETGNISNPTSLTEECSYRDVSHDPLSDVPLQLFFFPKCRKWIFVRSTPMAEPLVLPLPQVALGESPRKSARLLPGRSRRKLRCILHNWWNLAMFVFLRRFTRRVASDSDRLLVRDTSMSVVSDPKTQQPLHHHSAQLMCVLHTASRHACSWFPA